MTSDFQIDAATVMELRASTSYFLCCVATGLVLASITLTLLEFIDSRDSDRPVPRTNVLRFSLSFPGSTLERSLSAMDDVQNDAAQYNG